jgi:hypothetical protein
MERDERYWVEREQSDSCPCCAWTMYYVCGRDGSRSGPFALQEEVDEELARLEKELA